MRPGTWVTLQTAGATFEAIAGDTVVAGAAGHDDLGFSSGSAYVFSLEGCVLELHLDAEVVRSGDELRLALHLQHNRPETVTVPFLVWVEDEAGTLVVGRSTPPLTFLHGDTVRRDVALRIPEATPPGRYAVMVGIEKMRQGVAGAGRVFRVVSSSVQLPSP